MIDYDDGTPASTPQMAFDVANFITFMQRRIGAKYPDKQFILNTFMIGLCCFVPMMYLTYHGHYRNILSFRLEAYAVRDGVYYKHFRTG